MLRFVKSLAGLKSTRVLILTTSNSEKDRSRCTELGADGYLVKPPSFTALVDMLRGALAPSHS